MILYREKTQIRFCINITDTGKREKMLRLKYVINSILYSLYSQQQEVYEICLFVLFCSDIKRTFRLKNVLLHDHSKR